jgi:hypothetical protein
MAEIPNSEIGATLALRNLESWGSVLSKKYSSLVTGWFSYAGNLRGSLKSGPAFSFLFDGDE